MKVTKRERILRHFKRMGKLAKFIKKHINKKLGRALQDWVTDRFDEKFYGGGYIG
jgi:hypothetical protein